MTPPNETPSIHEDGGRAPRCHLASPRQAWRGALDRPAIPRIAWGTPSCILRDRACAVTGFPAPVYWSRAERGTFFGVVPDDLQRRSLRGLSANGRSFSSTHRPAYSFRGTAIRLCRHFSTVPPGDEAYWLEIMRQSVVRVSPLHPWATRCPSRIA